ncbi:serine hydrolase [Luteimonas sp. RD2P54]|uniref:Beta-lactamase n=1 Tax=Luteimonas endophytica TaxID=3042023 RepID=A0ABT6JAN5_9GAMM|nr:serine hydrolase [Luteimonas endophytica]MDH5823892.1 serine hydrolase [Luteimonas endophytica]
MKLRLAALAAALAASGAAQAMTDAELAATLDRRLSGDRTGACLAAAVVEAGGVARAWRCADPADQGRIGAEVAFEIGSVAKTMTAALLADQIARGGGSLDDPLADWLPASAAVPAFEGEPILLRHVVTHTSGLPRLPPGIGTVDPRDPYAALEAADLFAALGRIKLTRPPGAEFEYSNFASMLLSVAVAHRAGEDFETLLDRRLFAPLGMEDAYVAQRPDGVRLATGHDSGGKPVPPWRFHVDLAGAGGVRATLDDMVRYVQAHLGRNESRLDAALAKTREPLPGTAAQPMAMNWLLAPLDERTVHVHEGATGGFSSFVALDTGRARGVVVLSDTALYELGGLGDVGNHLMDARLPLGKPRTASPVALAPEALAEYAGEYPLMPGFSLVVRESGGTLHAQATGQGEFPLDARGDDVFEAPAFDIEIRFRRDRGGSVDALELHQAGQVLKGERR